MPTKKNPSSATRRSPAKSKLGAAPAPPTVSPRWLFIAILISVIGAIFCAWATLCLLFWQGSWQLLYHPSSTVARTPADAGVAYDPVGFAATDTGELRIGGWWIPAAPAAPLSRFTVLYLHGATGNLGNSVDALAGLHSIGVNVLAFDYRGYGHSQFAHPSENRWRQDAGWALDYLTQTRHTDPHAIVLMGNELGADLALEIAAAHPELAGVVVSSPWEDAASVILDDPRAHLVPARLLVSDRYNIDTAAAALRIPSLWLVPSNAKKNAGEPAAFAKVSAPKQLIRLNPQAAAQQTAEAVEHWLTAQPSR